MKNGLKKDSDVPFLKYHYSLSYSVCRQQIMFCLLMQRTCKRMFILPKLEKLLESLRVRKKNLRNMRSGTKINELKALFRLTSEVSNKFVL